MDKLEFGFLPSYLMEGDGKLDIFNKSGLASKITDFAVLMGGYSTKQGYGWWWTSTQPFIETQSKVIDTGHRDYYPDDVETVFDKGHIEFSHVQATNRGARPAISFSSIASLCGDIKENELGVKETEFGEYPQKIVEDDLSQVLDSLYEKGELTTTGKTYSYTRLFEKELPEFEYDGKLYVRAISPYSKILGASPHFLSNGKEVEDNKAYWVEVKPVKWLIDEEKDIAITSDIVCAGKEFSKDYFDSFSKDIIPAEEYAHKNDGNMR